MAYNKGANLIVTIGAAAIAGDQSCNVEITNDIIEYTVKGVAAGGTEYGHEHCRITGTAMQYIGTDGVAGLETAITAQTKVTASVELANGTLSGSFVVESISYGGDDGAMGTAEYSLVNDGAFTIS